MFVLKKFNEVLTYKEHLNYNNLVFQNGTLQFSNQQSKIMNLFIDFSKENLKLFKSLFKKAKKNQF